MVTGAVNAVKNFYVACAAIFCTDTSQIVPSKLTRVDVEPPVFVPAAQVSPTGTGGTSHAPPQICMVVSWRTAVATRSGRGRTYLGPLSQSAIETTGALKATSASTVRTAGQALLDALHTVDPVMSLVVWKRPVRSAGGGIITPGVETPITSCSVVTNPYTQRRRAS
jgi:hypothetical protein